MASSNPGTSYNSILLWLFTVGVLMTGGLFAFIALTGDGIIAQHDRIRCYPCVHLRRSSLSGQEEVDGLRTSCSTGTATFFFPAEMYCSDLLMSALIRCTEWPFPPRNKHIIGIGFQWCFFNVLGMLCSKYKSIHAYRHNMDALVLTGHLRMAER